MRKRWMSLLLAVTMLLTLTMPVLAAPVTPTAPSWWNKEDYIVFSDDAVYQPENWKKILELRADAENGNFPQVGEGKYWHSFSRERQNIWEKGSDGQQYEMALIMFKHGLNDYALNQNRHAFYWAYRLMSIARSDKYEVVEPGQPAVLVRTEQDWQILLWSARFGLLSKNAPKAASCVKLLRACGMTAEDLFAPEYMSIVPEQERAEFIQAVEAAEKEEAEKPDTVNTISVALDGYLLDKNGMGGTDALTVNGRTMLPVRGISERLGATVEWIGAEQRVKLTRAKHTVEMKIGSKTAYVDGKPIEMDVAPFIKAGRTYLPTRYVAEFFGQVVEWNSFHRAVLINEDKTVAGNSNLEAWAISMGAMLNRVNQAPKHTYGVRSARDSEYTYAGDKARESLSHGWGINSREALIETILHMTEDGHNSSFLYQAKYSNADAYTKEVYKKWGDKGILAWDLFRMANVAEWGYEAGYVTYAESLALIQPAAQRLKDNFSSWEEAYENYLYGYCWWSGTGVAGQDIYQTERGKVYKNEIEESFGLDNSLFSQPIIPIPGVSAEDFRKEIM